MSRNGFLSIIPEPFSVEKQEGYFLLNKNTRLLFESPLKEISNYFCQLIHRATGLNLIPKPFVSNSSENSICLIIDKSLVNIGEEGYILTINPSHIQIAASTSQGVFYGIQTLRQLLPNEIEDQEFVEGVEWSVPALRIIDYPRFQWRGFMLDVGRHFHDVNTLKHIIDLLCLLKMNKFHLHLTEDQGWRFEIIKYPLLTQFGSKREKTQTGGIKSFLRKKFDTTPLQGYFTKDDIKDLQRFTNDRFIEVIPEIELPGHSMAALASYPNLGCTGGPYEVQSTFGIKADVFCPGKEVVFNFLNNVLEEVMLSFPSPLLHIGGDETPTKRWEKCNDCQRRMAEENLANEKELQRYFINRITSYLVKNNRTPICWNDVLSNGLRKEIIIQYWLGSKKNLLKHLRSNRKVIMSNFFYNYLDYNYYLTPLRKTYSFNPIPKKLENQYHSNILGVEAPLWTEWVSTNSRLFWQMFPRIAAVAEVGWTSHDKKNYGSFKKRLEIFNARVKHMGVNGAPLKKVDPGRIKRLVTPLIMFMEPKIKE